MLELVSPDGFERTFLPARSFATLQPSDFSDSHWAIRQALPIQINHQGGSILWRNLRRNDRERLLAIVRVKPLPNANNRMKLRAIGAREIRRTQRTPKKFKA
jgi:hypothetical protein